MEEETCWICFGGAHDPPPNARSSESTALLKVCKCSLGVHKRCLVDWAKSVDVNSRLEKRYRDMLLAYGDVYFAGKDREGRGVKLHMRPHPGVKVIGSSQLVCPQCKKRILLKFTPTDALSLSRIVRSVVGEVAWKGKILLMLSALCGGAGVLAKIGHQMWRSVAGEGVIKDMLKNPDPSSIQGLLSSSGMPLLHKCLDVVGLAMYPTVLHGIRSKLTITSYITSQLWTLWLCSKGLTTPRLFMLFFQVSALSYKAIKSLTISRVYYRWLSRMDSKFMRSTHPREFEELETEATEYAHSDAKKQWDSKTWFQKFKSWLFASDERSYSKADKALIDVMMAREESNIRKHSYEEGFHKNRSVWRLITTYAWPFAGAFMGNVISLLTPFDNSMSTYLTPEETKYLRNLVGMGLVAIVRDLWVLFVAWNEVQMYEHIEVVDSKMNGVKPIWALSTGVRHTETSLKSRKIKYTQVSVYNPDKSKQRPMPDEQGAGYVILGLAPWTVMPPYSELIVSLKALFLTDWFWVGGVPLRRMRNILDSTYHNARLKALQKSK